MIKGRSSKSSLQRHVFYNRQMSDMPVLTLPNADALSLSVRAKALVFEDPLSQAMLASIRQIAPSDATALVVGETGTGKEIVARYIHQLSDRRDRPFLAVNCGAFTESLVESELFGHEKGAFTGALWAKPGWFESAHGGTLFLDEIGDLPLGIQVKLLRVLQEREVVRLGSREPLPIDVRLVAATNVNLAEAVRAGKFREDLYYRLNVAMVVIPPLRDRPGDVLPLVRHFLNVYAQRLGAGTITLTPDAADRLVAHAWPGNIRELENAIHHALLVCRQERIEADDLRLAVLAPAEGTARRPAGAISTLAAALEALYEEGGGDLFARVEEMVMRTAYSHCDRNQLETARLLGISRNVVRARLIQYGDLKGPLRPGYEAQRDDDPQPRTTQ
jgi:sigma-54-specific transcriptional regulator